MGALQYNSCGIEGESVVVTRRSLVLDAHTQRVSVKRLGSETVRLVMEKCLEA